MNKRTIAIILEIIPIVSAILSYILLVWDYDSVSLARIILVTFLLAFLGFVFYFVGRRLAKEDKVVRILGVFDWLSTIYVVLMYMIAILLFAQ